MKIMRSVVALAVLAFVFAGAGNGFAAEKEELRIAEIDGVTVPLAAPLVTAPAITKRPAILPALYVTLGAMQAWDIYSTRTALDAGAVEGNATAKPFAGHAGAMLGLKAATTAGTIYFAERMWKKNKAGAIVMLAIINGATAAVSMHNMRNARTAAAR